MKLKLPVLIVLICLILSGFIGINKNIYNHLNTFSTELQQGITLDTTRLKSQIQYKKNYPFIRYDINSPEWQDTLAMAKFYRALGFSKFRKTKVLHIGDSHVQADFFTGTIRDKFQENFGAGGRGLIFPYASAGTHATRDYKTYSYGTWRYAKNIHNTPEFSIGLTGATIYTEDEHAGFRIQFREGFLHEKDLILKLYCDKNIRSFDALIIINNDTLNLNCSLDDGLPYAKILLPALPNDFQIRFVKNHESSSYFQCYGLNIENTSGKGILYHSVGINGAGYTSLLRQGLMPEQLRELNPDLLVIDLGANDFYPKIIDQPVFEENLRNIIRIARSVCPGISILVSCSQDIYCRKKNVAECKRFAAIARNIAFENKAAFYDYYQISGGQFAMNKWLQQKLAKADRVHLTSEGYYVKGELYFNAFLNGYIEWMRGSKMSFQIPDSQFNTPDNRTENKSQNTVLPVPNAENPKNNISEPSGHLIRYTVKSGDNLGSIAEKYKVGVTKIKSWNGLASDRIRIGQVLKIYTSHAPSGKSPAQNPAPAPRSQNTNAGKNSGRTYIVKSGDTLWDIAQKNNCSVEEIKSLNKLQSAGIKPGMKIILP